jgi:hypothetical protein
MDNFKEEKNFYKNKPFTDESTASIIDRLQEEWDVGKLQHDEEMVEAFIFAVAKEELIGDRVYKILDENEYLDPVNLLNYSVVVGEYEYIGDLLLDIAREILRNLTKKRIKKEGWDFY